MIIDPAHTAILDRHHVSGEAERVFGDHLGLLSEVINYGTNALVRLWSTSKRTVADSVVIGAMLRNTLVSMDTIEVCLRAGQVQGASMALRSLLESSWGIAWVLQEDTDRRAKQYFVAYMRQQKQWALRVTPGTDEHKRFTASMTDDFNIFDKPGYEDKYALAKSTPDAVDRLLATDEFREINTAFDAAKRRHSEPAWYQPNGPNTIYDLATAVGRRHEYRGLYSQFSETTHGSRLRDSLDLSQGPLVVIEPVRGFDDFSTVLSLTLSVGQRVYMDVLGSYRPGELENYRKRYVERWRERFLSVPDPKVEPQFHRIDD